MTAGAGKSNATKMCLACSQEFSEDLTNCPKDGTTLMALPGRDDWVGKTLADRYEVTDLIGKGGMGVVYLGRHTRMERMVAIKMLQAELAQDDSSVKRFEQEAKAASCLNHPHLITLHDFGITPTGQPFLVMEFLEGRSLLEVIKLDGPVTPARAGKIFSQAADGLSHAHHQGIVHRDLKPSNILLIDRNGESDFVKVLDFGLAKLMPWSGKESQHLTKTGEVFGSPIYMSPEQCMGRELRPTSDIYSLCITLYEALTGKPPFRGPTSIQTASLHMHAPPPKFEEVRPDLCLPHALETVVMKGLQKDPNDRFQSMMEFSDALQTALNDATPVVLGVRTPSSSLKSFKPSSSRLPISSRQPSSSQQRINARNLSVDSTNAIPAHKIEQDKRKAEQAGQPSGLPIKIIIAAAVLCAIITSATAAVLWFTHRPMTPVAGTLYYVDLFSDPRCVDISDNATGTVRHFTLSEQAVSAFSDNNNNVIGHSIDKSGLGDAVQAEMLPQSNQWQSVKLQAKPDSQITTACEALRKFLEGACQNNGVDENEVGQDKIGLQKAFTSKTSKRIRKLLTEDYVHSGAQLTNLRKASCFKILRADSKGTSILVDPAEFVIGQEGYWRFNIDLNHRITTADKANLMEWNRETSSH